MRSGFQYVNYNYLLFIPDEEQVWQFISTMLDLKRKTMVLSCTLPVCALVKSVVCVMRILTEKIWASTSLTRKVVVTDMPFCQKWLWICLPSTGFPVADLWTGFFLNSPILIQTGQAIYFFFQGISMIMSRLLAGNSDWLKFCSNDFFIPAKVMVKKYRGKLLSCLDSYYKFGILLFSSCEKLKTGFTLKYGILTSVRPLTALATQLNIS